MAIHDAEDDFTDPFWLSSSLLFQWATGLNLDVGHIQLRSDSWQHDVCQHVNVNACSSTSKEVGCRHDSMKSYCASTWMCSSEGKPILRYTSLGMKLVMLWWNSGLIWRVRLEMISIRLWCGLCLIWWWFDDTLEPSDIIPETSWIGIKAESFGQDASVLTCTR